MTEVEIGESYILLKDEQGEIVKWIQPEWEEEPELVPTIANAVKLACEGNDVRDFLQIYVEDICEGCTPDKAKECDFIGSCYMEEKLSENDY